ncbi:MAG: DHH family phosphoesterase [Angelakisella sp.]
MTIAEAATLLLSQDLFTILCHRSPDGDTLGSAYALHYALQQLGKQSAIHCADPVPPDMVPFLGDGTFFAGNQLPEGHQLLGDNRFCVAVDVADSQLLGTLSQRYQNRVGLVIDHHPSNLQYGKATCLLPTAAATAEVMTALIEAMGVTPDRRMASCLYLGLATDTGCFRYSNTTAATLRAAARVLELGADNDEINRVMFETKTPGRVALETAVMQQLEYFCDQRCAIISVPFALLEKYHISDSELDGLSALPRQIAGVEIGITIREQANHLCRVSVRTERRVDAAALCATFGGGGHLRAGGCTVQGDIPTAKKLLLTQAEKLLC